MPLPSPTVQRKHIHTRHITCEAYESEDGLWDVEANMTDTKTYDTERGKAGRPLHNMWVRLTLDTRFVIRGIESAMDAYPQQACPHAVNPMQDLVGVKIGAGWQAEVRQRIGGALGCTHLRELLAPTRRAKRRRSSNGYSDHGDAGDGRRAAQPRDGATAPGQGNLLRQVRRG